MSNRFSYVRYGQACSVKQQDFKLHMQNLEEAIDAYVIDGRYKQLALNALEEAYMWIGKAIRDEQIALDGGEVIECAVRGEREL